MIPALKSEFRKLLTVRSTYVIIAISLAILIFFAFYIEGIREEANALSPNLFASEVTSALQALGFLIALPGLLLVANEYRYNTIMYTLTSIRSRTTVLLAKFVAVSVFAIVLALLFGALSPLLTYIGLQIKDVDIVTQNIEFWDLLWRALLYGWGYAMLAFVIAFIVRNQVGALAVFLLFPAIVENLLALWLGENAVYTPFNSLAGIIVELGVSHERSAMVLLGYVAAGLVASWALLRARDAN